ncbi:hypothetical protein SISNIDRAFT_111531 [Sistotremastrum niveocremeum HHB9708]|uniref:Ubiquitin 3 binding protein But2 C-terminal domain-containing protein n=1 Tax=Sistotremastrum niveocremeum HHB9708 TaxID=1314777 RepID=A0A164THV2_9AGAM|nr:hypothetical protein SISNIDRAFT_111531 [Sistotremastrum niveocremeum HHB9708]
MSRNLQRRRRRARLVFATLVLSAQFASAQTHSFVWGFAGSTTLTECGTIGLFVSDAPINGSSVVAKPPYYMMAYEVGGIATSSPIGAVNNNLQWTVPYKSGAQLLLDIADSLGNTGGVGPQPYPVVDGTSTNCHPSKEDTDVTLSTDVTALTTCDPLVLNLGGGQTPYTISLVATNAPVVTNVTLGPEDNQYTWINRGTPGSSLLGMQRCHYQCAIILK